MNTNNPRLPLVSVLAVSYNHERWVVETLESIKKQTLQDFELIFADDASTDRSAEIALDWIRDQQFPCRTFFHRENLGLCSTLNEALSCCRGKYFKMIACDDVLRRTMLEQTVRALENAPDSVALACSNFSRIDDVGRVLQEQYFGPEFQFPDNVFSALLQGHQGYGIVISSPTVLIRRSAFEVVGPFDETLLREDLDMWLRISRCFGVRYVPDVLVDYRILPSSLTRNPQRRAGILWENVRLLSRFDDGGPERAAIVAAQKESLQQLLLLTASQGDWDQLERAAEVLHQLPGGGHVGWILGALYEHDKEATLRVMDRYGLSSGNRFKDAMFRLGTPKMYRFVSQLKKRFQPRHHAQRSATQ